MAEEMVQGYEVKARGQYYSDGKKLKMWENTFFIPKEVEIQVRREWKWFKVGKSKMKIRRSIPVYEKVNGRENAQYIIQRLMLPSVLQEKYPDSVSPKTCTVIDVKLAKRPASKFTSIKDKNIMEMSRPELAQFCTLHSLATPIDSFSDLSDARQAVKDSYDAICLDPKKKAGADDDLVEADPDPEDPDAGPGDGERVTDSDDLLS